MPGFIDPKRLVIDADNLRKLIGDPAVRSLPPQAQGGPHAQRASRRT